MDEKTKRPWRSFRWAILLWIVVLAALITACDTIATWRMERAAQDQRPIKGAMP